MSLIDHETIVQTEKVSANVAARIYSNELDSKPVLSFGTIPRVSVVIPTLNEAKNLALLLPKMPKWLFELIVVDGFSTDGTVEVARELFPTVKIVNETKRGKGAALAAGFRAASGDIIVTLDADGSMDPAEISASWRR